MNVASLSSNPPRLLVLGAGIFQLRLIRKAKAMGLETHVVSIPGDYPGIAEADAFYPVDTTDIPAVVDLARNLRISGVVTAGTDVCIPTLGAVCDALDLPGISHRTAETISYKNTFRRFQHENGLPAPRFVETLSAEAAAEVATFLSPPLIVKPVDSSGSRGVQRIEEASPESIRYAFDHAVAHSRSKRVCMEEFIPGVEVGGNALLSSGQVVFLGITAKFMNHLLVKGHSYPTSLSEDDQRAVRAALEECCTALEYTEGPLNFDVMVDSGRACIIELGARLGGNGLTDLMSRAFGYDIEEDVVRTALGEKVAAPPVRQTHRCGSLVFGSGEEGIIESMPTLEDMARTCPFVFELVTRRKPGDRVSAMRSNADLVGCVLFDIPDPMSWQQCADVLDGVLTINLRLAPPCARQDKEERPNCPT